MKQGGWIYLKINVCFCHGRKIFHTFTVTRHAFEPTVIIHKCRKSVESRRCTRESRPTCRAIYCIERGTIHKEIANFIPQTNSFTNHADYCILLLHEHSKERKLVLLQHTKKESFSNVTTSTTITTTIEHGSSREDERFFYTFFCLDYFARNQIFG